MKRNFVSVVIAGATLLTSLASAAWADLKIVTKIKVDGAPEQAQTQTPTETTTYMKGDKVRVESGATVTITDYKEGKIYTINPKKKTYTVMKVEDATKAANDNPFMAMMKMDVKADVTPTDETGEVLGRKTKTYKYTATVKMTIDESAAAGTPLPPGVADMIPTIVIKGENWVSDSVKVPGDYAQMTRNAMSGMMRMFGEGLKEFQEKMAKIPGYPMKSKVVVDVIFPATAPQEVLANAPGTITTTTEVVSLSEETLDDSLFEIGADLKEEAIQVPTFPGAP